MDIEVQKGDIGLTYAIKRQLVADGADTSNLNNLSVWNKILKLVDEQNEQNAEGDKLYTGGNDKTRAGWGTSYKVYVGKVLKFSEEIWNKIKALAGNNSTQASTPASAQPQQSARSAETQQPVPESAPAQTSDIKVTVQNENKTKADTIAVEFGKAYAYYNRCRNITGVNKIENALKELTPETVAYFVKIYPNIADMIDKVDFLGYGFDEDEVYKYIMLPLAQRADALGIQLESGKTAVQDAESRKGNMTDMKNQIEYLQNWIINKDKENLPKAQDRFDKANALLVSVANMNPKPKIITSSNQNSKTVALENGQWISIEYDSNGEISNIRISCDTTPNKRSNSSTFDGSEVSYYSTTAWYDIDHNNELYEGQIQSGYNFENLKAIAEMIFGKKQD